MKKLLVSACFLLLQTVLLNVAVKAQSQADIQKEMDKAKAKMSDPSIQAKMKRAQMMSDSMSKNSKVQASLQKANDIVNQQKAQHPNETKDIQVPTNVNTKVPSVDAITSEMNNASSTLQNFSQQSDQAMPKRDISKHADKLLKLSQKTLVQMAQLEANKIKPNLTYNEKDTINLLMKDSTVNLSNIGVFVISSGGAKNPGAYLICQGVIRRPNIKWTANDLGVLFRDMGLQEQALQCFLYAGSLDSSGKSVVINTNIAWAAAYYGDFETAHKYFDKALAVDENFSSALEGEAILAFQEGNIAALFQALAKQIKYMGMGGDGDANSTGGPSDEFTSTCTNAASQNGQSNNDNSSNSSADDDEPDQDAPPTADVEPVTYPFYKPVFINNSKDLLTASPKAIKLIQSYYAKQKTYEAELQQKLSSLKPLDQRPYRDDEGELVHPNKFSKYVELIAHVRAELQLNTAEDESAYTIKMNNYLKTLPPHDQDLISMYAKEMAKCDNAKDEGKCKQEVNCIWIPKMINSKNSDIEAAYHIWNEYYKKIRQDIQDYLDVTKTFIQRVHAEGWNEYLNLQREIDVRMPTLKAYNLWCSAVVSLASTPLLGAIQQTPPACPMIDINGMDAPDPTSYKKPKHIKEYEGFCYNHPYELGGIGGIISTCHTTTFFVGHGPLKAFYERVDDPIYAENNEYVKKGGVTVGVSKWLGLSNEEEVEEHKDLHIPEVDLGVKVKAEATGWLKFDAEGNCSGAGLEAAAEAEAGAEVKDTNSGVKFEKTTAPVGVEVSKDWEVVAGQGQVIGSPLSVKYPGSGGGSKE
jgi:tetratricopeptide (TPR) repeat protein